MKIGIVGAGPRGLSLCERLVVNHSAADEPIEIFLFDHVGIGGSVWREEQSKNLKMNTVAQQVTLFTDDRVDIMGKKRNGLDLFQWSKQLGYEFIKRNGGKEKQYFMEEVLRLKENDVTSRALYGFYQRWFYQQLRQQLSPKKQVTFFKTKVLAALPHKQGFLVTTEHQPQFVDQLALATGYWQNEGTKEETEFFQYAKKNGLIYQPPSNAADVVVDSIPGAQPIFFRGLGLAFFDYLSLFSLQRGGKFEGEEKLRYIPSGREPKMYAVSRRGVPYFPRGKNQKGWGEAAKPHFLTPEYLNKRKQSAEVPSFFDNMKKEVELVYYRQRILEEKLPIAVDTFTNQFIEKGREILSTFPSLDKQRWNWEKIADPARFFTESFQQELIAYLQWQISEAKKGTIDGPVAAAIDVWKDLRDPVRFMLFHNLFSKEELECMWQWFVPLDAFLTIGPPLERSEELLALIESGILTILPPKTPIKLLDEKFSVSLNGQKILSDTLIEARLPDTQLFATRNPLLKNLRQQGLATSFTYSGKLKTGALAVERKTNRVLTSKGIPQPNLYCFGLPVEGEDWLTASVSRPGTNAWNLRQADKISLLLMKKNR